MLCAVPSIVHDLRSETRTLHASTALAGSKKSTWMELHTVHVSVGAHVQLFSKLPFTMSVPTFRVRVHFLLFHTPCMSYVNSKTHPLFMYV